MTESSGRLFSYGELPPFEDFGQVLEERVYRALPEDWLLGLSDVVDSRKAIAEGRYKAVNMAGAAVISAVMNALGESRYPFVFGGDGAAVALPGEKRALLEETLAATACWVRDDLELELRVAVVPISEIRAAGHEVKVARFAGSDAVDYAMFSGGGLAWAEKRMKEGAFRLAVPEVPLRPDLSGLSCRWEPSPSQQGVMLSLIAQPAESADPAAYRREIAGLLRLIRESERDGHPVAEAGPRLRWPPSGLDYELRAQGGGLSKRLSILTECLLGWVLFKTGKRLGAFDPGVYRRYLLLNSDYRKFDDGLKVTLDCSRETADALAARLERGRSAGLLRYGLFEQEAALMTCIVPSLSSNRHFHFLDGIAGGYAAAADRLK